MKYKVQEVSNYFLVIDLADGKTVKVYPEKRAADMYCHLLNSRAAV